MIGVLVGKEPPMKDPARSNAGRQERKFAQLMFGALRDARATLHEAIEFSGGLRPRENRGGCLERRKVRRVPSHLGRRQRAAVTHVEVLASGVEQPKQRTGDSVRIVLERRAPSAAQARDPSDEDPRSESG